ncbi:hypothetical protein BDN71DRAFT_1586526 [Pleurotus eryngii]|uniref:Nucleolar 27S pre-rRNA processing Urb2/Npa2 C-terminal domain-containing protein n=1 Tax=Pleurotus eryngii TaxID=5323 RepID=A0A9P6AA12_PLEER|nr:hypothetical protein BDN71DRAFT_1586526 [Pleurotus eryngii]
MATSKSGLDLIHALKASSDPPVHGEKSKIDIAREAWNDQSFYLPGKAELLGDFILTRFAKDKENDSATSSLLDIRYWTLLLALFSSAGSHPSSTKSWLSSSVNSFPVASVLAKFFKHHSTGPLPSPDLISVSSKCFSTLWSLAGPKLPMDAILDCFTSFLEFTKRIEYEGNVLRLGFVIVSTLRVTFGNLANKKKWYITYVHHNLRVWLEYCQEAQETRYSALSDAVYGVGTDIIFNIESLKASLDRDDDTLFPALNDVIVQAPLMMQILPRLYRSYIQALKTNKHALFDQGSSRSTPGVAQKVAAEALAFYASCRSLLDPLEVDRVNASTRVALLSLIQEDKLYRPSLLDAEITLKKDVELAIAQLQTGVEEEIQRSAIECLNTLTRIDYELVSFALSPLLTRLLLLFTPLAFQLLDLLIDYHARSRSIDVYVHNVFEALDPTHITALGNDGPKLCQASSSGALLHPTHLDHLGRSIRSFATPNQTKGLVKYIVTHLQDAWSRYEEASASSSNGGSGKKARVSEWDIASTIYTHSARLSAIVLSSLSINAVSSEQRSEIVKDVDQAGELLVKTVLGKLLKVSRWQKSPIAWSAQIVAAAALRLHYSLCINPKWILRHSPTKLLSKAADAFQKQSLLPELSLELFHTLMFLGVDSPEIRQDALDRALTYIIDQPNDSTDIWNGQTHFLTQTEEGSRQLSLAFLHLIIQRWLPSIDSPQFVPQLRKLADITLSTDVSVPIGHGLSVTAIIMQGLQSAQTWESPNFRKVLIASVMESTSTKESPQSDLVFQILLLFPIDYLPRSSRVELIKRAQNFDFDASNELTRTILRTFLARELAQPDFLLDDASEFVYHLLHCQGMYNELQTITMDLIGLYLRNALRDNKSTTLSKTLELLSHFDLVRTSVGRDLGKQLVDALCEYHRESLSKETQGDLLSFHQRWLAAVSYHLETFIENNNGNLPETSILLTWVHVLSLGRWLESSTTDRFVGLGQLLVKKLQREGATSEYYTACLAILIRELDYYEETELPNQLDTLLATYVVFHPRISATDNTLIDSRLAGYIRTSSTALFSHVLDQLAYLLTTEMLQGSSGTSLLHLASVLLHDPPQGSLKATQKFSSECFRIFADSITNTPRPMQQQILAFISICCSERPAVLRPTDTGNLWSTLAKMVANSKLHDGHTSHPMFQQIVAIIGTIVRLRRDLLVNNLPQLGHTLSRLLMCLRTTQHNLGAMQKSMVLDTFPQWIVADEPLTVREAKALARLLENINAKTVVRNNAAHQELQKAESLAKPFSKHATYILKAYVTVMNDPLCVLPLPIRKELRSGLFVLCGMVNDHSRDAIMVSLDVGGKLTLKSLWQEYEKQRYHGQG